MNFNSYLSASILSHLLLLGLLYTVSPLKEIPSSFITIDIVPPAEESITPAPVPPPPIPRAEQKEPLVRSRRKPPEEELPPRTLLGEGTGTEEKVTAEPDSAPAPPQSSTTPSVREEKQEPGPGDSGTTAPRDALFDRGTIEKFADKGEPLSKGLTFDTSGFKHRGYMRMLKERIEDIWKYPKEAARQKISGDLYIKFSIRKDGSLEEIELVRTSGYRQLDEAAMQAVKKAEPFWPLPEDMEGDILEIKGHFIYVFGNTLIM